MRQRRKRRVAAGIRRFCASCTLFTFLSVLGTVISSRDAFSTTTAAAAAAREAPEHSIKLTHRKDATSSTNQRLRHLRQIKMVAGLGSFPASAETEATAAPPLLKIPPSPPSRQVAPKTHVVIASFGEPEPYHAVSLFFASRLSGATVHHVIMHTYGKGHEPGELNLKVEKEAEEGAPDGVAAAGAQLHQARNYYHQQQPSVPWRTIYRRLGVHRSNVDLSIEDSYHALARSYMHSSARQVDYELLCFARFIGLHSFCTEKGIKELTFLDADVIVFDQDFLKKVRIPANHSLWTVHDRSSFLASMTCSSIGDFVNYIVDFYQQPDRRKIVSTIDTYGDDELDPSKLQGLRDREPAFDSLGVKPKLFSDMYLFDLFLHDQLARSQMNSEVTNVVGDAEQSETKSLKTPQATTLPPRYIRRQGREEKETQKVNPISRDTTEGVESKAFPVLPPYVHSWNAPSEPTPGYFTLIENMRSVTLVPHTRAWLCLDRALFDAHFRINITSQSARTGGGAPVHEAGPFQPLPGAHFQGDCKAKMMQLLYGDVIKAIEDISDA